MSLSPKSIFVNQLGYLTGGQKRFWIRARSPLPFVLQAAGGMAVYAGITSPAGGDYQAGDFSALCAPGTYQLEVGGSRVPVVIRRGAYRDVLNALLRFFDYQLCGVALPASEAGPWAHGPCHTHPAQVLGEARTVSCNGGWHDAGDYGKYTVPAAKAVADLLLAHECFPSPLAECRPMEAVHPTPHLPPALEVAREEVVWLLSMQDPETGGVYHKVSTAAFPPLDTRPEDDAAPLVLCPISYAATATFCAAMAHAAVVYRPFDPALASCAADAARRAYAWLLRGDMRPFRNPAEIRTGEYGDDELRDELLWASCAMLRLTGDPACHALCEPLLDLDLPLELGWADVALYGVIAYLMAPPGATRTDLRAKLVQRFKSLLDDFAALAKAHPFGLPMRDEDFIWGSNMVLLNRAMSFLVAEALGVYHPATRAVVQRTVDYLLGANPLGQCYVTGFGTNPVCHPHHRPSVADDVGDPVPGMVAGGPNRNLQDEITRRKLAGRPAMEAYIDHQDSYSTNEVAIYWNSPAVLVVAGLMEKGER
ncbi:glycoside hydrolase family 9 protein [Alicyclobacillus vulcanalis]|uniref:Endoglucanase n=1 Tax=Alicyclobacillus vulcanalis TaxID=252246 RepID=A0A1N7JTX8_9BACL|nr:glycoside hydrolase family 9 protein [Alicyclobacillus vulcanalis]SIS52809.1 non-processive endocellulase [Alicyclobacillus vulcanalis]